MEFVEFTDIADWIFLYAGDIYKRNMWAYFLIGACCFGVLFIFKAIALFTIAKREGYAHKWMAFVPFLNTYYIGVVSEKNRIFGLKARTVSIVAAAVEFAYVAMYIIYCVAQALIFYGGYARPVYESASIGETYLNLFSYYEISNLPASLSWAGWVYAYFYNAFLYWLSLLCVISNVLLMITFFQTYSCRYYVPMALFSALFPIGGILMFAVRNNAGKNYAQYVKERQYQRYRQYQEYMRQNGGYDNRDNTSGGDPYGNAGNRPSAPDDPFGGMGESGDKEHKDDDPFGDF